MKYSYSEPGQIIVNIELSLDDLRALLDIVDVAYTAEGAPCRGGALRVALLNILECTADRMGASARNLAAEVERRREGAKS